MLKFTVGDFLIEFRSNFDRKSEPNDAFVEIGGSSIFGNSNGSNVLISKVLFFSYYSFVLIIFFLNVPLIILFKSGVNDVSVYELIKWLPVAEGVLKLWLLLPKNYVC